MKEFVISYLVMAFGVFLGNWLIVPIMPGTHRTYYDGFMIGLIAFGLIISVLLIGVATVQIPILFKK